MRVLRLVEWLSLCLRDRSAVKAAATWPSFSIASWEIVRRLEGAGVAPDLVLDVGANDGQFAITAVKRFRTAVIHSFEPLRCCQPRLDRLAAREPRITIHPFALGETSGEAEIVVNSDHRASSILKLGRAHQVAFPSAHEESTERIQVRTLDDVFPDGFAGAAVLLKLDVQGYEASVLAGATRVLPAIRWIVLETSFQPMYEGEVGFRDLLGALETKGFRFVGPVGWLEAATSPTIVQMDALFERARTP